MRHLFVRGYIKQEQVYTQKFAGENTGKTGKSLEKLEFCRSEKVGTLFTVYINMQPSQKIFF